MDKYLYLFIDLLSVFFPFVFSFVPQANFSKKWRFLWPGITIAGLLFIVWDMAFTHMGVWGFNPRYVTGLYLYNLPIEEVLFFICIPYSSIFLYEALNYFFKKDLLQPYAPSISIMLVMFLLTMGLMNTDRWYTGVTFIACAIFIALNQWKWKAPWMGRFYFGYLFVLIPFFMVNGILTGSFIDEPVVWYNEHEFLGIRMGTIPFEDTFYGMLMLMMSIAIFENRQLKAKTSMTELVVLVDEYDRTLGTLEKMEAHHQGVLHRAISVLIFNTQGDLLLQQRAKDKYHSGGLWTNTCCSHPRPNETPAEAAARRLQEEMGIAPPLQFSHTFIYKAKLDQGLTEHELDHVFTGVFDGEPNMNPNEASDWKYIGLQNLQNDLEQNPQHYTAWFKIMMKEGKLLGRLR